MHSVYSTDMSFEKFGGFVSAEVAHKDLPKKSEKSQELLRSAQEAFPQSTLLHKVEGLSDEDIFALDIAFNRVGVDFSALGGFEGYESSEEIGKLSMSLDDLSRAQTPEEKRNAAQIIAEKIR